LLELEVPELAHPIQGASMVDVILNNGSMKRTYIVSESWSQATVITENFKLGIMLDPTLVHRDWDYREFGDMFFDRRIDRLEITNCIGDNSYRVEINTLRGYYEDYITNTPATGKEEMVHYQTKSIGQ
jgi:hypothetical protein